MSKILLVEDDKSLREIYGVRLSAEGYEIVAAGDGEEALAIAVKERPDLVISDVMMPKISGFDMLDILRATPETKDLKVVMMTALSSDDQRQRGEALGADRYLVKSQVGIEDIVRTVHEVLGDTPGAQPAQAEFSNVQPPIERADDSVPLGVAPAQPAENPQTETDTNSHAAPIEQSAAPAFELAQPQPAVAQPEPTMPTLPEDNIAPQPQPQPQPQSMPQPEPQAAPQPQPQPQAAAPVQPETTMSTLPEDNIAPQPQPQPQPQSMPQPQPQAAAPVQPVTPPLASPVSSGQTIADITQEASQQPENNLPTPTAPFSTPAPQSLIDQATPTIPAPQPQLQPEPQATAPAQPQPSTPVQSEDAKQEPAPFMPPQPLEHTNEPDYAQMLNEELNGTDSTQPPAGPAAPAA